MAYQLPENARHEAINAPSFQRWLDGLIDSKPELAMALLGPTMANWLKQNFKPQTDDASHTVWVLSDKASVQFFYAVYDKQKDIMRLFTTTDTDISPMLQKLSEQLNTYLLHQA